MTPLFEGAGPRVFGVAPGADFAGLLASGLRRRLAAAPAEALARVEIVVNTQRTLRAAAEAFEAAAWDEGAGAAYLPRLTTLDRVAAGAADAPPPETRLARRLALTRLVERRLALRPDLAPPAAAGALAKALAGLMDEMRRERVPAAALADAVEGEHAAHWAETHAFLAFAERAWADHLAAGEPRSDPEARRAAEVDALAARWAEAPPETPVIVAGSTGSQRLTADLMVAVAGLPQGGLILPGFDFALDEAGWAAAGPDHPQYGFKRLLERLALEPADVTPWEEAGRVGPRARLMTQALRPAPATHHWRAAAPALAAEAAAATDGLTLVEAANPAREAEAIAVMMRGALERDGAVAALVTPDRTLARRVAAALGRWGLEPDDSSGRPLALTPPGVLLTMLARALAGPFDAGRLLALLKHPLVAKSERGRHLAALGVAETRLLRRRDVALGLRSVEDVAAALRALCAEDETEGRRAALDPEPFAATLETLAAWPAESRPLPDFVEVLSRKASALTGGAVWDQADGRAAADALAGFARAAESYGEASPGDLPALLAAALEEAGDVRDDAFRGHPQLKIWGPLEARAQTADLVILGGLNEDVWPQSPAVDPWLSRPMRERIGLPAPERRVGLSAHDFLQAASAPEAALTRSLKADGAPTTPSRWLVRLETLLGGVDPAALVAMRARGAARLGEAEAAASAAMGDSRPLPAPAPRPAPRPPAAARPRALWVTDVEALIRDPYAVYAKRVLGLRRLDEPGATVDARTRGDALHKVVERFVDETKDAWPAAGDAARLFDRIAAETLSTIAAPPAATAAWAARLARVRGWFVAEEAKRRAAGRPLGVEIKGAATVATAGGAFEIKGRADRIDALRGGGLAIYDYKAGQTPSDRQVARFAKQLPLLALIAEAGGFDGVAADRAAKLAYLSLSGDGEGGRERPARPDEDAAAGLARLIEAFEDEARAYLPRAFPETMDFASDYDHLSRYGEWDDRSADP